MRHFDIFDVALNHTRFGDGDGGGGGAVIHERFADEVKYRDMAAPVFGPEPRRALLGAPRPAAAFA